MDVPQLVYLNRHEFHWQPMINYELHHFCSHFCGDSPQTANFRFLLLAII